MKFSSKLCGKFTEKFTETFYGGNYIIFGEIYLFMTKDCKISTDFKHPVQVVRELRAPRTCWYEYSEHCTEYMSKKLQEYIISYLLFL